MKPDLLELLELLVHNVGCGDGEKGAEGEAEVEGLEGEVEDEVGPIEGHHSDPVFMGGDPNQELTPMDKDLHRGAGESLHNDLNNFLREQTDEAGNHMRPQRDNSGLKIRDNFNREQRLDALADFYKQFGGKYPDAARDFFKQHPHLK